MVASPPAPALHVVVDVEGGHGGSRLRIKRTWPIVSKGRFVTVLRIVIRILIMYGKPTVGVFDGVAPRIAHGQFGLLVLQRSAWMYRDLAGAVHVLLAVPRGLSDPP